MVTEQETDGVGILEMVAGVFSGGSKAVFLVTGFLANEEDATQKVQGRVYQLTAPC